jgi:hypothetical protein
MPRPSDASPAVPRPHQDDNTSTALVVHAGSLQSLAAFSLSATPGLARFSNTYVQYGQAPPVMWDLSHAQPLRMSMAALTAFLSVSDRIRRFSSGPQQVTLNWNSRVLSFWNDIGLIDLTRDNDLISWPHEFAASCPQRPVNPSTRLLYYPKTALPTPEEVDSWKSATRERIGRDIASKSAELFQRGGRYSRVSTRLRDQLFSTCAELATNSLLWGEDSAAIGLQRSSTRITVAVSDSGKGFEASLSSHPRRIPPPSFANSAEAIVWASLVNIQYFGLRRAISSILDHGGWVTIASEDSEVHWRPVLWNSAQDACSAPSASSTWSQILLACLGPPIAAAPNASDQKFGYWRRLAQRLRGVRISFELPAEPDASHSP